MILRIPKLHRSLLILLAALLALTVPLRPAYAAQDAEALRAMAEERKLLPVSSNEITGWPDGPMIGAEAAILMEADTGTVLYAKNIHERLYPASTTKLLTCLIASENGKLSDEISFSQQAVFSLPSGSSNIGIDPGEAMTLEEALYGILVGSANEVANAVAEYIGGSIGHFVELMNTRARELQCADSHFVNANGLPDEQHYTSAYDLAMIGRAFFNNPVLARISGTPSYHFRATPKQKDDFTIRTKNKLINGEIPCEGLIGGKTGYTDLARETLVTCAERGGMKLICVVLKEENPAQYTDTAALFDYGFNSFRRVQAAAEETRFLPVNPAFSASSFDIFGNAAPFLAFDRDAYIILPAHVNLEDTDTAVVYGGGDGRFARIDYSWRGVPLGTAEIFRVESDSAANMYRGIRRGTVTIRLFRVLPVLYGFTFGYILLVCLISFLRSIHFGGIGSEDRRRFRRKRRENRREHIHFGEDE